MIAALLLVPVDIRSLGRTILQRASQISERASDSDYVNMGTSKVDRKSIVILGGSWGGVSLSHYILKHVLPALDETYQVILISSASQAFCRPAAPRALISDDFFPQEKLFVDIPAQFTQYPPDNFTFLHATVTALDTTTRTVTISPQSKSTPLEPTTSVIPFHSVVIATGATAASPLLGLSPGDDISDLRSSWTTVRAALPTARRIVVAGGGPSGVEVAGELGEHLNGPAARKWWWFGTPSTMRNPRVEITLVSAGERILPDLRQSLADTAEEYLAALGVKLWKGVRVKGVEASEGGKGGEVVVLDNGETIQTDLYIPCVGIKPNTDFIKPAGGTGRSPLLAADGRVETNPRTLRVDKAGEGARIYAIGDASSFATKPGVHNTLSAVPILAANMKRDLDGAAVGKDREFEEDLRETQLVPVGRRRGVGAMKGWRLPSWAVWLIKGRDYWLWTTGDIWSGKAWAKKM